MKSLTPDFQLKYLALDEAMLSIFKIFAPKIEKEEILKVSLTATKL